MFDSAEAERVLPIYGDLRSKKKREKPVVFGITVTFSCSIHDLNETGVRGAGR